MTKIIALLFLLIAVVFGIWAVNEANISEDEIDELLDLDVED